MNSIILSTATRYMMPLLLLFSLFVMLRGHNDPGGGFVGGLVAAAAFSLITIAQGVNTARQTLIADPRALIAVGLLVAVLSGLAGTLLQRPFMTGLWTAGNIPVLGKIGSPQTFDVGVYMTVLGVVLTIVFALAEASEE